MTIILTSHYMEDVRSLCPRSVVVNEGCKIYDGRTEDLFASFQTHMKITVQFESETDFALPEDCSILKKNGHKVVFMAPKDKSGGRYMRKYLEVFHWSFKMQIVWRFDVAMTIIATIGRIVAAWILWSAIFAERDLVGGFTFGSMLSYYIVSSFLSTLDMSDQISGEVSYLIKDGGFSKHMVMPMNPFGFFSYMIACESA